MGMQSIDPKKVAEKITAQVQQVAAVQVPVEAQAALVDAVAQAVKDSILKPASKPWQSKTLWIAGATALLPFVPGVGPLAAAWVSSNPETFLTILGAVFSGLRLITNKGVAIK